ncbi:MerR family DNA-binding transcriptional regulator [Dietzia sp. SLG310A2-38A2]|uniref:MerR family DNA-binding transcriptional regulator n=1 Tax=Dietzia sp. SLG310A2-38A2 TaxID=1630643 RepID=UPI0015FC6617|nr:MerR family DNA-binding transcriptional regulator [Dietzia sp. SLG310A2-38A2]MBB1031344.1 MerR family DNA-binding transcriptional regulator [Dietzia sp. SLG310A2-38A2]
MPKPQVDLRSRREGCAPTKIGEVAGRVGVDIHVLRHWHDMGVVIPDRAASGHRDEEGRAEVIERRLHRLRSQRSQLEDAERFLEHVIGCTHDLLTRCPDCSRYASRDAPTTSWPGRVDNLPAHSI